MRQKRSLETATLLKNRTNHIAKFIFWGLLIAFSLTPCSIKKSLFDFASISYTKPSSPSKAASSSATCLKNVDQIQQGIKQTKKKFVENNQMFFNADVKVGIFNVLKQNKSNSPPKYILFKCLKVHLA